LFFFFGGGGYLYSCSIIGVLGTIMICALPAWKVFINTEYHHGIYGAWHGLWKICTIYATGKMECVEYEVVVPGLVDDTMKAIRALVIIAILSGIFGILLGVAGNKRINFMLDDGQKRKAGFASGVVFIIAGFLVLIPVCWMANITIRESYKDRYDTMEIFFVYPVVFKILISTKWLRCHFMVNV
uniref:Claudin n=1 Tax=Maylandia zebra TaxID=106582 RepID=A0A3P9DGA9_9CICH